jgi:uncharacterized Fe-S center protein
MIMRDTLWMKTLTTRAGTEIMTRLTKSALPLAALMSIGLTVTAYAQTATEKSALCQKTFEQCKAQCISNYENDNAQRAPCVTVCSGRYAACDAGVVYDTAKPWVDDKIEKAKPWLEEQSEKAKRLFDDLMKEYGPKDAPSDSQKKTKDNSI